MSERLHIALPFIPSRQRLCLNEGNAMFVILSEAKNPKNSKCYKLEILRLTPQNDITTQSLMEWKLLVDLC